MLTRLPMCKTREKLTFVARSALMSHISGCLEHAGFAIKDPVHLVKSSLNHRASISTTSNPTQLQGKEMIGYHLLSYREREREKNSLKKRKKTRQLQKN